MFPTYELHDLKHSLEKVIENESLLDRPPCSGRENRLRKSMHQFREQYEALSQTPFDPEGMGMHADFLKTIQAMVEKYCTSPKWSLKTRFPELCNEVMECKESIDLKINLLVHHVKFAALEQRSKMYISGPVIDHGRLSRMQLMHPHHKFVYQKTISSELPAFLTELILSYCNISDQLLEMVGGLRHLKVLDIRGGAKFHDGQLRCIGKVKSLTEFYLDGPTTGSGLVYLLGCVNLKKLRMRVCVENLCFLNYFNHLESFEILKDSFCSRAMKQIALADRLRELSLDNGNRNHPVDKTLSHLTHHTQLETLKIWNCPTITDVALETIGKLENLKALLINKGKIHDDGVRYLTACCHLEQLELDKTNMTDKGLRSLMRIPHLTHLTLRWSLISLEGVKIFPDFPSLRKVILSGENFWNFDARKQAVHIGKNHHIEIVCPW